MQAYLKLNYIQILLKMSAQHIMEMSMGKLSIFVFILSSVLQSCVCRSLVDDLDPSQWRSGGHPKFPVDDDNSILHEGGPVTGGGNQPNCGKATVYQLLPKKGTNHPQTRIVGGNTAHYGAYPWQVEIQKYNRVDESWDHQCGGTLVSDLHILTAAHCLYSWDHIKFRVIVGDHHLDHEDAKQATHTVDKWTLHPEFQDVTPYSNDIAIIKLLKPVTMSSHVNTACLPTSSSQRTPGTWCVVSGWGLTEAERDTSSSKTLQAAAVPLIADDICSSEKYYGDFRRPGMMCAGYELGHVDACNNDSGGPLTCEIGGQHILMGAVSWGKSCGKKYKPGVYSNVLHYIDWVHKTMAELKN